MGIHVNEKDRKRIIVNCSHNHPLDFFFVSHTPQHRSGTWYEEVGYGLVDAGAAVTTPLYDLLVSLHKL